MEAELQPLRRLSVIVALTTWPPGPRRAFAERAVRSVLEQRDPIGTEVVLAEDGSKDDTLEYFRTAFPDELRSGRLHVPNFERFGDGGRLRNAALDAAQGQFIAFLEADDSWGPQRLARLEPWLNRNDLVVASNDELPAASDWVATLLESNFAMRSSIVLRRGLLDQIGGYPVGTSGSPVPRALPGTPEYELMLRALTELARSGRRERFAILRDADVQVERPPLPAEIQGIQDKVDSAREALALLRVARKMPSRYWLGIAKRVGRVGKGLFKGGGKA